MRKEVGKVFGMPIVFDDTLGPNEFRIEHPKAGAKPSKCLGRAGERIEAGDMVMIDYATGDIVKAR